MDKWVVKDNKNIADILVEVYGKNKTELLKNVLQAFTSIITEIGKVNRLTTELIKLEEENIEEMVFGFVDKLIYFKDTQGLIFKDGKFRLKDHCLEVRLFGQKIDERVPVKIDIKALTYHKFEVKKMKTGYKTILVFDV